MLKSPTSSLSLCLTVLLTAFIAVMAACRAEAGETAIGEYELKAVFILNFARFTRWPETAFAGPQADIVVGIFGEDVFGPAMDVMAGETVGGRQLTIRRLGAGGNPRECHILFVAASEQRRLHQVLDAVKGRSVLTVSDMANFAAQGGMIQIKETEGRLRLTINLAATKEAGLALSAKLLKVATIVGGKAGSGQ